MDRWQSALAGAAERRYEMRRHALGAVGSSGLVELILLAEPADRRIDAMLQALHAAGRHIFSRCRLPER